MFGSEYFYPGFKGLKVNIMLLSACGECSSYDRDYSVL